jgi:hypothetical protein
MNIYRRRTIVIAPSIDERVSLAIAVRRYLQSNDRFHSASKDFDEACHEVRKLASRDSRYVVRIDYRHWLLEIDSQGNFEVEEIELL